jgi:hypothetical protein
MNLSQNPPLRSDHPQAHIAHSRHVGGFSVTSRLGSVPATYGIREGSPLGTMLSLPLVRGLPAVLIVPSLDDRRTPDRLALTIELSLSFLGGYLKASRSIGILW